MHRARCADKAADARLAESNRVKNALSNRGFTLSSIDRAYGLPRGTASTTLREPNIAGERAIAAALKPAPI